MAGQAQVSGGPGLGRGEEDGEGDEEMVDGAGVGASPAYPLEGIDGR